MLDGGELGHIGADLREHRQRRGDIDAIDAGEIHAAHLEQVRAQIKLRRVARAAPLLAFGELERRDVQALQLLLNLAVALGELSAVEVEQGQRLLERE